MSEVLAARDEASTLRTQLESERDGLAAERAKLEKERSRVGSSFREELDRLRDDVQRQVAAEIKNLRESDRNARANVNAAEIVRTLTKPVDKALDFLPSEQRDVHVGEKAEHRSFKVTGTIVSIDGKKAVLNVNGRKMTVDVKDLVPLRADGAENRRNRVRHSTAGTRHPRNRRRRRDQPHRPTRRRSHRRIRSLPRSRAARRQTGRAHHPRLRHRHASQGAARASAQTSGGEVVAAGRGERRGRWGDDCGA